MMRVEERGSGEVFLTSQLVEISQRFQPDVEDLQVLLQEEGLPVQSAECLQELSARLGSDPRFRRDVAFLVRSMIGREQDAPGAGEPGSMDVLGVLIVAAAGTRQEIETPARQQLMRELLRFVVQQRRPAAASAVSPAAATVERRAATPAAVSPAFMICRERPLPASSVVEPNPVAVPSLLRVEREPFWRAHVRWVVAVLAALIVLCAGLVLRHSDSKAITRDKAGLATVRSPASPTHPATAEPEHGVVLFPQSSHISRKSRPPLTRATRRRAEPTQASVPITVAANTRPKMVEKPEPAQNGPKPNQLVVSSTVQPVHPHHESAAVSLPANVAPQPSTSGSTDVNKVFAHPEAASAIADSQTPPPVFRPKDPVLIARNSSAPAALKPEFQGTVHIGSMGALASSLMYCPEPAYPVRAIAEGVEGEVTVRAVVGPRGNVIDAHVVSGPPLLREAALEAVSRWRYRPNQQDGKPVAIATTAILDFEIPPRK